MKSRKGISTVVGAVFFVIIFTTTISYVTYNMNLLSNFSNAIVVKSQSDVDTYHEKFLVTKVTIDNNKFNITVQNTGNIPLNITRMYVQNKTDITWGIHKYAVNQIVYPGHSLSKIGQSLPLFAKSTQGYDLNLVTTRGNIGEFFVNSVSQEPVYLQLYTLPSSGSTNFNTTLLLAVTNNMTNGGALSNIQPNMVVTNTTGNAVLISGPTPSVYPILNNGEVAIFQWTYKITGNSGQTVNFKLSLKNGYLNNFISQDVTIANAISVTNIGHGGKGVYSGMQGSVIQLRNITSTNTSHVKVSQNTTDVSVDTGPLVLMTNGTLTGNMDLGTTGTAKIGSGNLIVRNPASTFATSIVNSAIVANRTLNLPLTLQTETLAVKPNINFTFGGAPANTASTTGVMSNTLMTFVPKVTGRIQISVCGTMSSGTATDGAKFDVRYGTTAITEGNAVGNTLVGTAKTMISTAANNGYSVCNIGQVTGLTVNTKIFIQIGKYAVTGGTASFSNFDVSIVEL